MCLKVFACSPQREARSRGPKLQAALHANARSSALCLTVGGRQTSLGCIQCVHFCNDTCGGLSCGRTVVRWGEAASARWKAVHTGPVYMHL